MSDDMQLLAALLLELDMPDCAATVLGALQELEAWRTRFPGYRYKDGGIAIQEVVSE